MPTWHSAARGGSAITGPDGTDNAPAFPPGRRSPDHEVPGPANPAKVVLDNGLVVYLLEDHELPLIKLGMYFQAGTQYDPIDKVGLGSIYGEALTTGGSVSHTPEEIEKILDRKAASINVSIELENGQGAGAGQNRKPRRSLQSQFRSIARRTSAVRGGSRRAG